MWYFITDRCLTAFVPGTNTATKFRHNKVHSHVNLFKEGTLEYSVKRYRTLNLSTVEMHTAHLGSWKKALGIPAKKEYCSVTRMILTEKMQMSKHISDWSLDGKRKLSFKPGQTHKIFNGMSVYIAEGCILTWSIFEVSSLNDTALFEIINKT